MKISKKSWTQRASTHRENKMISVNKEDFERLKILDEKIKNMINLFKEQINTNKDTQLDFMTHRLMLKLLETLYN